MYTVQKLPLVFQVESVIFPTVYMLWKLPDLLYCFTTWPPVFPKITGGADLMLPGVVLKDGFHVKAFGDLKKGDRVAVNLTTNKAPVAVGKVANSSIDLYMSGKRGKAVHILHCVGDELWAYSTKLEIPQLGPPEWCKQVDTSDSNSTSQDTPSPGTSEQKDSHKDSEGTDSSTDDNAACLETEVHVPDKNSDSVDIATSSEIGDISSFTQAQPEAVEDSKENMDELLGYCFLKALNTTAKKAEYPMLTSKFYKVHLLPACPAGKSVDIKKSSYKKLSVFLHKMNDEGVLKLVEQTKGVESIMSVNSGHPLLKNFVFREDDICDTNCTGALTEVKGAGSPTINEMYITTAAVLPLLSKFGFKKGESLPAASVRKHLTEYVKNEKLQDTVEKRKVKLDPLLAGILKNKTDAETLTWDDLISKFLSCMTHSYSMSFSGQNAVVNKGKLPPIDLQVGRRTGNKKVTLVDNLELYGVDMHEFARDCQHGVAASTSISNVPGKKCPQLMVQGNQVHFVGNLLQGKYQIAKKYIRGLELAPKPKK